MNQTSGNGFSRRRLLVGAAGLGAAALLGPTSPARASELLGHVRPKGSEARPAGGDGAPRVAIVGAGLAGLTCAYRLHQRGIPSTLYEARARRVGGRCWTAREFAAGQTAEHGGEFIDTAQHRIRALAAELELTLDDVLAGTRREAGGGTRLVFGGRRRGAREVLAVQRLVVERAIADSRRIRSFTWNRATPAARRLDEMTAAEWLADALPDPSQRVARRALEQLFAEEYGLDPSRLSAIAILLQFGSFAPESDERFHVHGGNDQIAWGLAERLPAGTLQLDAPLTRLRRRGSGFALSFAGARGETIADIVVLCLPFTALRRVDLEGAGLGRRKRRCIEDLGMGTNAKLLLQFRRHLSHYEGFSGSYFNEDFDTWDSSVGEAGRPGLLTVFSGGSYGARQRGHGPHAPAPRARVKEVLGKLAIGVPSLPAGFNGDAWLDHWTSDPWTHGSYAAFEPGQYTRYWGFVGRPEGRILFGGEHTALAAQGYLDGAVASGERCAGEVAALAR